jgi:hypothetical protein
MPPLVGRSVAEAHRAHFDLQLRFAEALAARSSRPLVETLTFYTHLHRRLGHGNVARAAPDPAFTALAERAAALPDHAARIALLVSAYSERPVQTRPISESQHGCFGCEAPDARGHVRIHFSNRDSTNDVGPLLLISLIEILINLGWFRYLTASFLL